MAGRVAVAYSGGRDSTALLHATARAARALGVEVLALHVHHGLNAAADAWLAHCAATCRRWAARGAPLAFAAARLQGRPARGDSTEAWARRERYRVLATMAAERGASLVLLAQHRRDQAETLLLQALRGGGPAGLAAMPERFDRGGVRWARPWLDMPREAIEAYLRRHRLRYIDDESNADARLARNRLRRDVWPTLMAAFPQAEATLATSAAFAAEAREALAELAAIDLPSIVDRDGALRIEGWSALSPARRTNALRAWLTDRGGTAPPASLTRRLLREIDAPGSARWSFASLELRRHRGRLCIVRPLQCNAEGETQALDLACPGLHRLPHWGGALEVTAAGAHGVTASNLADVRVQRRRGGERFQLGVGRPARSLKHQYQALGVAPWQRDGPLLYSGNRLLFVAGLGIDARALAAHGEPQFALRWWPDADR